MSDITESLEVDGIQQQLELDSFLRSHGLEKYIAQFQEHNMTLDTLKLASADELKELVPTLGDRIKIRTALVEKGESPAIVRRISSADTISISHSDSQEESGSPPTSGSTGFVSPIKRMKRVFKRTLQTDISNFDIKEAISSYNVYASTIVRKYSQLKNSSFTDSERNVIADALVQYAMKNMADEVAANGLNCMSFLAEKLVECFPSEAFMIYFREPTFNAAGVQTRRGAGKLVEKFYNLSASLRKLGTSPKDNKRRIRADLQAKATGNSGMAVVTPDTLKIENNDIQGETDFMETRNFLKYNKEPWLEVLDKWKGTSVRRLREAYNIDQDRNEEPSSTNNKCHTLILNWPLIKDKLGYSLLSIDFQTLYKLDDNAFFLEWEKNKNVIKKILRTEIKDKKILRAYQGYLESGISVDGEDGVLLGCLVYLFRPKLISSNGHTWRPTNLEIGEGFFSMCSTAENVKSKLRNRQDRLKQFGQSTQPTVIAIGDNFASISDAYVCIDDFTYHFSNPLKAIDICFKSIHALAANYDIEASRIWLLVQKVYFNIQTIYDDVQLDSRVETLQLHIKKQLEMQLEKENTSTDLSDA